MLYFTINHALRGSKRRGFRLASDIYTYFAFNHQVFPISLASLPCLSLCVFTPLRKSVSVYFCWIFDVLLLSFGESVVGYNSATGTVKAFMVDFSLEKGKNDKGYRGL
jgi:hypothetical protein